MKITKLLSLILTLSLMFSVLVSCGDKEPEYEDLILKRTEIVTCKNNGLEIKGVIDYEKSNISETETVSVSSTAENIAKFENNKIVFGNEYGEASLEIIVGNKKGSVNVKVVPYLEYLSSLANKEGASGFDKLDYYAASWMITNLSAFKNPSSVSIEDVYYVEGAVDSNGFNASYLIMEVRAQNGFGGYNVEYYKVTSGNIQVAEISSYGGFFKSYNGQSLYSCCGYSVNKAVQEYISENY
jgi:hypothetical protein